MIYTSWVAVVTPTDRPKSTRNRCVIEVLLAFLCCQAAFFDFSVGDGAFVTGLPHILFVFLLHKIFYVGIDQMDKK